jgi:hypothetical protein
MITDVPYNESRWRGLSRNGICAVGELLGKECSGPLHRHHVRPLSAGGESYGRTVLVCESCHPKLEALARRVWRQAKWKTCPHHHQTRESREACERRLNSVGEV